MNLQVSLLKDKWGTKHIAVYEWGKFSQPLFILAEGHAEKLVKNILLELKEEGK